MANKSAVLLILALTSHLMPEVVSIAQLDEDAVFSFAVMSDNKGLAPADDIHMQRCDQWIKSSGDRFIVGMGDHVKIGWNNLFIGFAGSDAFWHGNFYPNMADGENEYWGSDQADWGAGSPVFDLVGLQTRNNVIMNPNGAEYYAAIPLEGYTVHLIQLHFADTPTDPNIAFRESSRSYMMETLSSIEKTDKDIILVMAHSITGEWVSILSSQRQAALLSKADLVFSATTHVFGRFTYPAFGDSGALVLNTGAVGNGVGPNGYLQVHVLANPTRLVVQYQETANTSRQLMDNSSAFVKEIGGETQAADWFSLVTVSPVRISGDPVGKPASVSAVISANAGISSAGSKVVFARPDLIDNFSLNSAGGKMIHKNRKLRGNGFNMEGLPGGIYCLKFTDVNGNVSNQKIVKY